MSTAIVTRQTIQEKVQLLSPQKQEEVLDFIEFLLRKEANGRFFDSGEQPLGQERPRSRNLIFDWADGPDDPPEPYTSVELQHMANEWRNDDETAD
jgi:hypothetical protein